MGHDPIPPRAAGLADEDLLALAGRRDAEAFELLYDRHARVAFSLAFRLLGDRSAAEDLVQDAFLALWRGADRYTPARGSVRTWLLAMVHHRGVDRLRSLGAIARRQEALQQAELRRDDAPDAAALGIGRAIAGSLRDELAALPRDQHEVLRLAYYGGFTHHEISEMLQLPLGTVKSRMRLGLERLRRGLGAAEAAP
ncbi:sigma-70 family RNA polymerase sigma factor [Miltoncostaea marina]|uniref:sigma-70 family RNA polymerase sigma factor n=1 Tax=Miltoncostaea marina TaxID=2843215 RepID=UPI001C3D2A98|nr:sigma-70 family RNA polymerase sigma factor [Miltoncostaea marina]